MKSLPGQTLIIRNNSHLFRIDLGKILFIRIDNYMATLVLKDKTAHTCCKSLKELTQALPDNFIRISRQSIVNMNAVVEIKTKAKRIVLTDNTEHKISSRKITALSRLFLSSSASQDTYKRLQANS